MKKILLIIFLFIPFFGFSQTTKPVTGFLGIKFGSSKEVVLAAMKAKGYVLFKQSSNADQLAFNNVKLGLRKSAAFLVRFVHNKAYEADYVFEPEVEGKIIDEYDDIVSDITGFYGQGEVTKTYNSPYKATDNVGDIVVGLSTGDIDFHTDWFDANHNSISASIGTNSTVTLTYQDDVLTDQAIDNQKAKEKGDF